MMKLRKDFNTKIILLTITIFFLFIGMSYSLGVSCLRVPLNFGQLFAEKKLRDFVGEFAAFNTFKMIIDSLGTLESGLVEIPSEYKYRGGNIGYIPFALNESGVKFFKELFDIESASTGAYLLVYSKRENNRDVKNLPYGILLKDSKNNNTFFFDLVELFMEPTDYYFYRELVVASCRHLLDDYDGLPLSGQFSLKRAEGELHDAHGNLSFEMLTINKRGVFSFFHQRSEDFQRFLRENPDEIKGRNVVEIGVGTGVNLLHARKVGARSLAGTDISYLYVLLSRWQVQFAQDTGQIQRLPKEDVQITHESGFPDGVSAGHLCIIMNTPYIVSKAGKEGVDGKEGKLLGNSGYISEGDFMALFEELKDILESSPDALVLCRIFPDIQGDSDYFPPPSQAELSEIATWAPIHQPYARAAARAKAFLRRHPDITVVRSKNRDIFLLRATPAAPTSGLRKPAGSLQGAL